VALEPNHTLAFVLSVSVTSMNPSPLKSPRARICQAAPDPNSKLGARMPLARGRLHPLWLCAVARPP
jgi:hypothetical protein